MTVYVRLDELEPSHRRTIADLLTDGEEFIIAIREEKLLTILSPFYVLTDQRIIRYRKRWLGYSETVSDTPLRLVSRIGWSEQNFGKTGDLELRGPELEESIALLGNDGRAFANAARDQLAEQKQPA